MLKIVKYPAAILKKKAKQAFAKSAETQELIPHMVEAMYKHAGIGLAAPQIGVSQQIFVVETALNAREATRQRTGNPQVFLNPTILKKSAKTKQDEEGCLSLPGLFVLVRRSESVQVSCFTQEGKPVVIKAQGLAARIFQHEIDHLQGKLIIDRITPLARWKVRKELSQIKKTGKVQET